MQTSPIASNVVVSVSSSLFSLKFSIRTAISVIAGILIFVGFVMQLGGVGKKHAECKDWFESSECRDVFRLYWWICFFQIFVAVVTLVFLAIGFIETTRTFLSTFLGSSTALCMLAVERFLDDENDSSARSAVSGFIFSTIGNFLLIFLVGVESKQASAMRNEPTAPIAPLQQIPSAQTSTHSPHTTTNIPPDMGSLSFKPGRMSNYEPAEGSASTATPPSAPPQYTLPPYLYGVPRPPTGPKY